MNRPPPHKLVLLWVLTALLPGASCEVSGATTPLRIGLLLPADSAEIEPLRRGAELGVEEFRRIYTAAAELRVRGHSGQWGTEADEAVALVLDDGVQALIAPPSGAASHLALQIAGRTATPVALLCPDSSVTDAGIPWTVRLVPGNRQEAACILNALRHQGIARWSAVIPGGRAGREVHRDLVAAARDTQTELAEPVIAASIKTNLGSLVQALLRQKPEGILVWVDAELSGRMVDGLLAAGFGGRIAASSRWSTRRPVLTPSLTPHVLQTQFASFAQRYRRQFGSEPNLEAAMAHDAALLLLFLLQRAADRPAREVFPFSAPCTGATGPLQFDGNGNRLIELVLARAPLAHPQAPTPSRRGQPASQPTQPQAPSIHPHN